MATFKTSDVKRDLPEESFEVECESGNKYVFPHPKTLKADDLLFLGQGADPGTIFQTLIGDKEFYRFMSEPEIDGFALDGIFEAWDRHFDLGFIGGKSRSARRR